MSTIAINEIEVRAPFSDTSSLEKRLLEEGFVETAAMTQRDIVFDYPDGRLFRSGSKIRIRVEGNHAELTYKGLFQGDLSASRREELNISIPLAEVPSFTQFLHALGFPPLFEVQKHRRLFKNNQVTVVIDNWPILGPLVEIEGSEYAVKQIASRVAPDVEFRNYRLKELFAETINRRGRTLEQLKAEHLEKDGYDVGRIEALL